VAHALLLYSSVYGQTRKICEAIQAELVSSGHRTDIVPLVEAATVELDRYDAIVIGASIRNGKHSPAVVEFIRTHQAQLESRPSGFFSVNLVARKPIKNTPQTNPYVKKFIERSPWKPRLVGVFAGNLDYQRYGFMDRHIIRFIMKLTGGPTDLNTKVEYTNWEEVRRFAGQIAELAVAGRG